MIEDPGDEVLVDHLDADQRQAVAEDADDQGSDQRADDRSPPAEQARAAEHDGRDAVQVLGRLPGVRVADLGAADEEHRGEPGGEAGERVDAEQDAIRVDPGQPRGLAIVADRVDVPAPRRSA